MAPSSSLPLGSTQSPLLKYEYGKKVNSSLNNVSQKIRAYYAGPSGPGPSLAVLGGSMAVRNANGIPAGPDLSGQQEAMLLFERVPIVWTQRVGNTGGVLIAPKATECRFDTPSLPRQEPYVSNGSIKYRTITCDIPNTVKAKYHLVLSDGRLGGIQVRDVFQGRCRVGQFSQSYSKRAGTWTPGNFLKDVYRNVLNYIISSIPGSEATNVIFAVSPTVLLAKAVPAPISCGTAGTYEGLSTFSFAVEYINGEDVYDNTLEDQGFWKRQVYLFIRNGVQTTRLLDNTYGSSNNLADLYLWLLTRNGRTSEQQIDRDSLFVAARFMQFNGLFWNGVLREPTSISDWINSIGRFLLIRETKRGGRYGLRPLLPVTSTGAIDTGPLTPDWVFDSNAIEPGSYSIAFRDAESRRPFRAEMAWRQQGDDGLSGITRSTPVYYVDTPGYAPIESLDLTQFCTAEIHVVRAGMFEQAKRRHCTHTARATVVPGAYDGRLGEGDLIAIQLDREDLDGIDDPIVEWYSVVSMEAGREGRLALDLEHFPVDSLGRSLIALDVANATAAGDLFITGDSGPSCDEDPSRATDTSIPAEDAVSRTREEVYFYNKYGRFPDNNEYSATPGGQPVAPNISGGNGGGGGGGNGGGGGGGNGGGGGGGNGGGGGGGAQPPRNSPSQPNNPYGPPNWPDGPTGQPAKGKPPLPTPPPPATRAQWIVVMIWKNGIDGSVLLYEETVTTFGVGEGYCCIAGTTGFGSGLQVDITKVDTANHTESNYLTNSLGTGGSGFEFQGATLVYRDPDNPNNPEGRADSIGDGVRY